MKDGVVKKLISSLVSVCNAK